jgi:hypothetical protein
LRLEVERCVLGRLDLKALYDRNLEVNARPDDTDSAAQLKLERMLAVIDDHEDTRDYLEEFEHDVP